MDVAGGCLALSLEMRAVLGDSDEPPALLPPQPSSASRLAAPELRGTAWAQTGPFLVLLFVGGGGNSWLRKYFPTASPTGVPGRARG